MLALLGLDWCVHVCGETFYHSEILRILMMTELDVIEWRVLIWLREFKDTG